MDSYIINIGNIRIKWYSFLILIGMLIAYLIIRKEVKKKGLKEDKFIDICFYTIIIGILGARAYYVLFNLNYYLKYPSEIIAIWHGGLAIHGGLIAALIFLIIYTKKKNIKTLLFLDTTVVGIIIAQAIGRWGNFFNKEAYGRIVSKVFLQKLHLPNFIINGMYINNYYREPTFLYESIMSILGFIILLIIRKNKKIKTGMLTSFYLIWYGISRLIIESFRSDSLMIGNIKMAQLVSIISIISGIIIFIISYKKNISYQTDILID